MKRNLPLLLLLLAATTAGAQPLDTIRVCTYNVLNYGDDVTPTRATAVQAVVRAIQPDVLVFQGVMGPSGFDSLSSQVQKAVAPRVLGHHFEDGPNSDNAVFFDTTKLLLVESREPIHTNLRDINEWIFVVRVSYPDTIHLFSCHLKGGNTVADSLERINEAMPVRKRMKELSALQSIHHRIVVGSLNTYSSTDGAYQMLAIPPYTAGVAIDPLNRLGNWSDDPTFNDLYTYSTRDREFGGGVSGGLRDRFDFVLISGSIWQSNTYIHGSYTTFVTDGRHFNKSINSLPNFSVPDSIAQALYEASDHLPVYFDLAFQKNQKGEDIYHWHRGVGVPPDFPIKPRE